jgi:nucleoside-diphosphate-sugar epimerase
MKTKILVTGSLGQIGSELVPALRERYGPDQVVASDIRMMSREQLLRSDGPFDFLDCTNQRQIQDVIQRHQVKTIYHLVALLSAVGESKPQVAWDINMGSLYRVLEVARINGCAVFVPSSIGAFGPGTPRDNTPQDTLQRPTTMYGVTKVTGELLSDYYFHRFGVDIRGVRYPGIISYGAPPGGGTTDYAVEIFYEAIRHRHYTCFLKPDTRLDMMYMNFTPKELCAEITKHVPDFKIDYRVDPVRQAIADSWPRSLDDSAARQEWGWNPKYDLAAMVRDMLENVEKKLAAEEVHQDAN